MKTRIHLMLAHVMFAGDMHFHHICHAQATTADIIVIDNAEQAKPVEPKLSLIEIPIRRFHHIEVPTATYIMRDNKQERYTKNQNKLRERYHGKKH